MFHLLFISFSGCGRSVVQALDDIRNGRISPNDLPPIQIIVGQPPSEDENDKLGNSNKEPWYFSLNNRRLWVLKQCRKEGLLEKQNNVIKVRLRPIKSKQEQERYTIHNCSREAKFIREKQPTDKTKGVKCGKAMIQQGKGDTNDAGDHDEDYATTNNGTGACDAVNMLSTIAASSQIDESHSEEESTDEEDGNRCSYSNAFSLLM